MSRFPKEKASTQQSETVAIVTNLCVFFLFNIPQSNQTGKLTLGMDSVYDRKNKKRPADG